VLIRVGLEQESFEEISTAYRPPESDNSTELHATVKELPALTVPAGIEVNTGTGGCEHPAAAWATVKVCPPAVIVPERAAPGFAATW
jgi:hypothetical protein